MDDNRELVCRLRSDRARYLCDNDYSVSQLTVDCAEAAEAIEQLEEELKRQQLILKSIKHKNKKLSEELKFTREFIFRNDLQYALASEWYKESKCIGGIHDVH